MRPASISILGSCSVSVAGEILPGAPSSLFRIAAFLALSGHSFSASRQRLGALLWPDSVAAKSAGNLRQALSRIRHFQADHNFTLLDGNAAAVFIDASRSVQFDLMVLLDRLSDPAPRAALDLCTIYAGEFLADLPYSGSEFEDWLALQRAQLRDRCADRLSAALGETSGLSDTERVTCAQKLLELDPCNEEAYCCLMLYAAEQGHRSRIHALFDSCQRQLMRELGVRPSARTVHAFQDLLDRLNAMIA